LDLSGSYNPPWLSPPDHSHWAQELNLVQILLTVVLQQLRLKATVGHCNTFLQCNVLWPRPELQGGGAFAKWGHQAFGQPTTKFIHPATGEHIDGTPHHKTRGHQKKNKTRGHRKKNKTRGHRKKNNALPELPDSVVAAATLGLMG
jgi:hypothetical protein